METAGGRKSGVGGMSQGTKNGQKSETKSNFSDIDLATMNSQVNVVTGNVQPPTTLPQMWMTAPQGIDSKGRASWWEAIEFIQSGRQPVPQPRLTGKLLIPFLNLSLIKKGLRAEQLRGYRQENGRPAVLLSVSKVQFKNNHVNRPIVQVKGPVRLGPVYAVERS